MAGVLPKPIICHRISHT